MHPSKCEVDTGTQRGGHLGHARAAREMLTQLGIDLISYRDISGKADAAQRHHHPVSPGEKSDYSRNLPT